MWKQRPDNTPIPVSIPTIEPVRPAVTPLATDGGVRPRTTSTSTDQAIIGKGIVVRGEITGTDPLHIDGTVEGRIHIPGERVTVGSDGRVIAPQGADAGQCIIAREIVIMGSVTGNILASDRVEIRANATLAGDVSTARVAIEDGAYFRGGIDIRHDNEPAGASQHSDAILEHQAEEAQQAEPVGV